MAKFLIQDIMPPEKRGGKQGRHRPTDPETQTDTAIHHSNLRHQTHAHVIHDQENTLPNHHVPRHPVDNDSEPAFEHEDNAVIDPAAERSDIPSRPSRWRWSDTEGVGGSGIGITVLKAFAVCAAIIGAYVAYALITSIYEIQVVPRSQHITIDQPVAFKAYKEPRTGDLGYGVLRLSLSETMSVPASGSRAVSEKASGRIIVYNAYSTSPQRLIKNTRFESPSGKIYRINESIVIPGMKNTGTKTVPGSIEVTVYADEPGPDYNTEPTDFTIPGFKSDPERYKKFYARSKGPISGGASGFAKTVSDADIKRAGDELRVSLETKLRAKARGNLGKNQVLFDGGIVVDFSEPKLVPVEGQAENDATVERTATLAAVVFDNRSLAQALLRTKERSIGNTNEPVRVSDVSNLVFSMPETTTEQLFNAQSLLFSLTGTTTILWDIDTKAVAELLRGTEKRMIGAALAKEGTIESAYPNIRPFWRTAYPDDPTKITVTVLQPNTRIDDTAKR